MSILSSCMEIIYESTTHVLLFYKKKLKIKRHQFKNYWQSQKFPNGEGGNKNATLVFDVLKNFIIINLMSFCYLCVCVCGGVGGGKSMIFVFLRELWCLMPVTMVSTWF